MKLLIFADVHGNDLALHNMLEDIKKEKIAATIFAGDIFGYFYGQKNIIQTLSKIPNLFAIKGNHDHYYLSSLHNTELREQYCEKYGQSYQQILTEEESTWLSSLPEKREIKIENLNILLIHGGPHDNLEQRVYPADIHSLYQSGYNLIIHGHTHYRAFSQIDDCCMINPGSLGQPRDDAGFSYVLYDMDSRHIDYRTVNLEINDLLKKVEEKETYQQNKEYLIRKYEVRE